MTEDIQPKIIHEPYLDTFFIDDGYQEAGMTPGKSFWISVTAVDRSRNESPKISVVVVIPDNEPPLPPQGLIAENNDGRYVMISCNGSASLDVVSYQIVRQDNAGQVSVISKLTDAPIIFKDTTVTKGNTFIYYAVAIDSAGNQSLPGKIDTVFVKDSTSPPSPRNCRARITENGIWLKWERVIDFDLAGYNVYRSNLPSGVYEKINDEPLNELEFIDDQGSPNHYYKIKAVDTSGNESSRSEAVRAG
jgi:fibronectin type 3 domain-containing protein